MNRQPKPHQVLPVAILAKSIFSAKALAQELHIVAPVCFSPRSSLDAARGQYFSALLVDDSCWPLDADVEEVFQPALDGPWSLGYIIHLARYDARTGRKTSAHRTSAPSASVSVGSQH